MVVSQERVRELDSLRETFGAERVAQDERRGAVRALFDRIAPRYDLMNDLMSFGLHRLWKRATVRGVLKRLEGMNGPLVDLAGGTGDIAFGVKAADPSRKVIIADASAGMLEVARKRGGDSVEYLHTEAEDMPLEDAFAAGVTRGIFSLCHRVHPVRVLPSSKPGAVQSRPSHTSADLRAGDEYLGAGADQHGPQARRFGVGHLIIRPWPRSVSPPDKRPA